MIQNAAWIPVIHTHTQMNLRGIRIMKLKYVIAGALLAFLASSSGASAAIITGLYTTGVDNANVVLPGGAIDPHYTVLENGNANAVVMSILPSTYVPNNSTSKWVWQAANGQPTNVTRTFRTTFDLTGYDPSTAVITGLWGTDNAGDDILINGASTGNTSPTFTRFTPFTISSGFVSGINTLDFVVRDVGVISGFRVAAISGEADLRDPNVVPEPAGIAIWSLLGMAAMGLVRRRRSQA